MANIESKNLLTVLKANARAKKLPLDYTEVWESLSEAQVYLTNPTAYAGQTIKVLDGGEYHTYVLQPGVDDTLTMKEVGAITIDDIKQCVVVCTALPETGTENVLYINTTDDTGYIWNGTEYEEAFANVQVKVDALRTELMAEINKKAPIDSPTFTGTVTLAADPTTDLEAVTKRYVDALITNLENNTTPGIVNSESTLPTEGYQAGMTYRVSEAGTYAGVKCEVGDLIIVMKDHVAETASNDDFMVVQANIDGAVTGPETATNLNIAIFDGATGKVIKDSEVGIASLNDAIAKAHEHANQTQLDTYDKTQDELLEAAQAKVDAAKEELAAEIEKKADKGTTLAEYGIADAYNKTEIDDKLGVINTNLNTKLDQAAVQKLVDAAKEEAIETAGTNAQTALDEKVGEIGDDTTVKDYVDNQVTSVNSATDTKIENAKTELQTYADTAEADAVKTANAYTDTTKTALEQYADQAETDAVATAKEYTDTAKTELQTYADAAEADAIKSANEYTDTAKTALEEYADQAEADAITSANAYTDTAKTELQTYADQAETDAVASAKEYTDNTATTTLNDAKSYADSLNKVIVF